MAAISVGILSGIPVLDLNYAEDARAEADLNVVMNQKGEFIEIQGTACPLIDSKFGPALKVSGTPITKENVNSPDLWGDYKSE